MTNEEKETLEPMIRSIMEKSKGESIYCYEHPDYGAMVKDVPEVLHPLLNKGDDHDDLPEFDDIMDECSKMDHGTLTDAVNSLIYYWLDVWHKANDEESDGVWLYPLPLAIVIAERFALRECIPALLEIERQDREFAETFFDDSDMAGMPASIIERANKILADLERESKNGNIAKPTQHIGESREGMQLSFFQLDDPVLEQIRDEVKSLDINNLTPLEALNKLAFIKGLVGN